MAVTSIWPINRNPKVVIDYARNPEKTVDRFTDEMSSLHTIGDVIDYAADEMKTETRAYVTCINCESEITAAQEFMEVKEAPPVDVPVLLRDVRRVGYNVDQLLKVANSQGLVDVPRLRVVLDEVHEAAQAILRAYTVPSD